MVAKNRLVLVNPVNTVRSGFSVNQSSRFPPLGLGIVAGLTPESWDVELVDENSAPFAYRDADLVGITAFTSAANRAYEIADICRSRGVPVVMGGIHASTCTDEALRFADAVVIGEAESVWEQVLTDAVQNQLRPTYQGEWLDPSQLPSPRRDIYDRDYMFASVQTSRGCPMDCDFCSVTAYNGRRYRRRPAAQVLDELETIPDDLLFFVDDNIIGYGSECRAQALAIFQGMVERGIEKRWFCQASVNVADDPEVLDWASRAGCRMIFLGIEAEDVDALTEVNKRLNLKRGVSSYAQTFDRIHQAGIAVLGAFHGFPPRLVSLRPDRPGSSAQRLRAGRVEECYPRVRPANLFTACPEGQGETNSGRYGQLGGHGIRLPGQYELSQHLPGPRHDRLIWPSRCRKRHTT